tara:strand:- start:23 stop:241 length:219 start_codon:yes stop_codon:yes gene_type:complete
MTRKPGTPYRLSFVVRTDEDPSQLLDMLEQAADNFVEDLEPIEYETDNFEQVSVPSSRFGLLVETLDHSQEA